MLSIQAPPINSELLIMGSLREGVFEEGYLTQSSPILPRAPLR